MCQSARNSVERAEVEDATLLWSQCGLLIIEQQLKYYLPR